MTSTVLFRVENRAFSVWIREQQGTDTKQCNRVGLCTRAYLAFLAECSLGYQRFHASGYSCLSLGVLSPNEFLPHTLCDREKQDRHFLRIIQSTPSTVIPSLQNPCTQKEGGFLALLVARGSLATRPLLLREHCWQVSGYKIQRGHGVANDFFEQVYS